MMSRRLCLSLIAALIAAQLAATEAGARSWQPYEGGQPELIEGIDLTVGSGAVVVRHACLVAPDVLALTIDGQAARRPALAPYAARPGDRVELQGYPVGLELVEAAGLAPFVTDEHRADGRARLHRVLYRDDRPHGALVGPAPHQLWPFPEVIGVAPDVAALTAPGAFSLHSADDERYAAGLAPIAIDHKRYPREVVQTARGKQLLPRVELYLHLPHALRSGARYRITVSDGLLAGPLTLRFDDRRLRSEAIHVNLGGYAPAEPKLAYLSCWLGTGGALAYDPDTNFELVDDTDGRVVHRGRAEMLGEDEIARTPVYGLDFSAVTAPGTYRVVVPGIGCSFPLRIDPAVWNRATALAMTGLLHQRSGIALGEPLTAFERPRPLHPEDGQRIHLCDPARFFDGPAGQARGGNLFGRIQRSIRLDSHHPGAWGGWHDAADFDRSIAPQGHLEVVDVILDLHETDPAWLAGLALRVPPAERANAIPDALDEALWCTELFRRIQQADGGMPAAVEAIEHPRLGEVSWLDSSPVAITPPTPHSCWLWAGTAARLSLALRSYDPALAEAYAASALAAVAWIDANPAAPEVYLDGKPWKPGADDVRGDAALQLLRLTGDARWAELFVATVSRDGGGAPVFGHHLWVHEYRRYALYALYDGPHADPALQRSCREVVIATADRWLAAAEESVYRAIRPPGFDPAWCLSPAWRPGLVAFAHRLSGEPRFRAALVASTQWAMGANPLNRGMTSGLGPRSWEPFHKAPVIAGTAIPDGLPAIGPATADARGKRYAAKLAPALDPAWAAWPAAECVFQTGVPHLDEHTVVRISQHLQAWGHLAATAEDDR